METLKKISIKEKGASDLPILNPDLAFEIYYDLKSAPHATLLRTNLTSKYSNKPFSQNRLRALPVKLLWRLMTISNARPGLNFGKK